MVRCYTTNGSVCSLGYLGYLQYKRCRRLQVAKGVVQVECPHLPKYRLCRSAALIRVIATNSDKAFPSF